MDVKRLLSMFRRKTIDGKGPLADYWYGPATGGGRDVTPQSSLGISAYFACLANISEDMAKLPLPVYRKVSADEREPQADHPLSSTLNTSFNPDMTAFSGRQLLTQWAMGWGGGYAEIQRNGIGRPVALWPIHPSRLTITRNDNMQIVYRIQSDAGTVELESRDIFHLPGRLSDDGITGISIAQAGYQSLKRGMSIQDYGTSLLNAGMSDRVALLHPMQLDPKSIVNLRNSWVSLYGGTDGLNRGPAVLDRGMTVSRIGIPPKDAQLLDEAQFTPEDVARFFRCPLSKIGHFLRAQGWSTLETLNTDYVTDTLLPWDVKWAQEARRKLFVSTESDLYIKHNFNALMKGDAAARSAFYTAMFRLGIFSRNEIRAFEDMNSVDGGDTYFIESSNLAPLDDDGLPIVPEPVHPKPITAADAPPAEDKPKDKPQLSLPMTTATVGFPDSREIQVVHVFKSEVANATGNKARDTGGGVYAAGEVGPTGAEVGTGRKTAIEESTTSNPTDGQAGSDTTTDNHRLAAGQRAAEAALNHAFQRIARKEAKALRKAIKDHLDAGDREGFRTWTTGFYGDMIQELRTDLEPYNAVVETITSNGGGFGERCKLHAESSRTALLAALDEGGTKSVRNRAIEWEKSRAFLGVTHANG